MRFFILAGIISGASLAGSQTPAHPAGTVFNDTDAACKKVLASAPQPRDTSTGIFKPDCDASIYYFGIGHAVDYTAARQCAYAQRTKPDSTNSDIFAGPGILSMIYANGEGTQRNVPLARRFVCENTWAAPAELSFRLELLDKIAAAKTKPPHFDLCATATSGLSEGWCQSIDSRKQDQTRAAAVKTFSGSLPANASAAFTALQKAEKAFEDARTGNEVDLSGTGRAAFALEEQDSLRNTFVQHLRDVKDGRAPKALDPKEADRALNEAYALARSKIPAKDGAPYSDYGTVTFAGVQATEREWLKLRDAWMVFLKEAYPSYPANAFIANLSREREKQLRDLVGRDG